ncbi:CHAD domain-containing protein [Candidatus Thiodiazotropha sp. CDECU1]|uniref:CHAD domain-containing protein n=1 Tax=Candidatus Thiodiazotropha sp. CDECU1 TaxID=3065865 RepID=UPI00292FBF05|nr:CHAD domain-containing protein [Candidatus Thiodiazotropha sp. CDECU1]
MIKKTKSAAPIDTEQSVSEAVQIILQHNFNYLLAWEQSARSWDDIEGVHQTRVAFRRMRSALSAFRAAIPRKVAKPWSNELRDLASQLGMARDLDVFIEEGLGAIRGKLPLRGEEGVTLITHRHREQAYQQVNTMLDSDQYKHFKDNFPKWIDAREWEQAELKTKHRNNLSINIVPFSRRLLDNLERGVLEAGSDVNKESAQEMHKLRIECKKLRYAAEFFIPILKGLDDFIGHMKSLQDLLGILNDISVMKHLLDIMMENENNHEVLEYAGGLVGWRTRQFYEMLDTFDDRWEEFVNAKQPWWRKEP